MKIFFVYSPAYTKILKEEKVRILVNYAVIGKKGRIEIPSGFPEAIIDSGGYQLQMGTKTTRTSSIEAYSFWLNTEVVSKRPEVVGYMNLDIMNMDILKYPSLSEQYTRICRKNSEDTLKNQEYMESQGLHPIPVWHSGEPIEYLDLYCAKYDYVSIGGMISVGIIGKQSITDLLAFLVQKYPNTKFHLFGIGISGLMAFKQYRPYSVDFSTWSVPTRFGHSLIEDKKQLLKEVKLTDTERQDIKDNKSLGFDYIRQTIQQIKKMEDDVNLFNEPVQGLLL